MLEDSNFDFGHVRLCDILREKMAQIHVFANTGNPDQTPHSAASDQGLRCLPFTLLGISRLQWVKSCSYGKDAKYFMLIDVF